MKALVLATVVAMMAGSAVAAECLNEHSDVTLSPDGRYIIFGNKTLTALKSYDDAVFVLRQIDPDFTGRKALAEIDATQRVLRVLTFPFDSGRVRHVPVVQLPECFATG